MAINHFLGSFIFFYLIFPSAYSILQSEALLKLKNSFANATILDSWKPCIAPCARGREWDYVVCANGVASGLRLGHLGLSGDIDVHALVSLPGLRSISLVSNGFSGPIPDFHQISNLRGLFLSGNKFSGEIPSDYFSKLVRLRKVWLSKNEFSGQVPSSLSNLSGLIELHLEDNQFSGAIPPLVQPSLVSLNISNNKLEGKIPFRVMSKFGLDSFLGNPRLCGGSLDNVCNLPSDMRKKHPPEVRFLFALIPFGIVFLAMVAGIVMLKIRQDHHSIVVVDDLPSVRSSAAGKKNLERFASQYHRTIIVVDDPPNARSSAAGKKNLERFGSQYHHTGLKGSRKLDDIVMLDEGVVEFVMSDLMKAAAEVIGDGTLGRCYRATMDNGLTVMVKRIRGVTTNKMGRDGFDGEMRKLASLKHKNVLAPMAYHYEHDDMLLIYEHRPEGNLYFLLHGDQGTTTSNTQLNWPIKLKIIQGIAKGLYYLHCELSLQDLPHGNLKSSNVLLTPEHEPLLVDYAFSSLITSEKCRTALAAYNTPEAILHNQISRKCDVFCLGVVIFEILTGKDPNPCNDEGWFKMAQWARSAILGQHMVCNEICEDELEEILQISVACMESNPNQRLDMKEVMNMIDRTLIRGGKS